ncbi:uncharacterized protein LOC108629771 [Ceratina calcarata]|uniref:Uncharacterized protein LOC108629771 n=1 Tax=Ceratina calcarata TaxID=156304 RepID=A0AAJ7JAR7_9HYME|nr:uncharacterized protein LOC108629771 [Ceratina calcarata]XP_026673307.1 uncharacterized protein LOC108629771 [Ceratina calcarata]XP_026673308.1 uncharacterized protein LOC108629771 [Ceratina calcarata]XP_026673309.1 uncharacterized protein LOC108629771 [Ceratina calcarata]XP_026673310.1 uncharacterized protein LOC108629771 [Ceratina calcarata]
MDPYDDIQWLRYEGVSGVLITAVSKGNLTAVQEFLANHIPYQQKDWRPGYSLARLALAMQHTNIVKVLLTNLLEIYSQQRLSTTDLLHLASIRGDEQMINLLITEGVHMDATDDLGRTALQHAVINNNLESTRLLLSLGANIDIKGNDGYTAIHHSIIQNNSEIIGILLKHKINVVNDENDLSDAMEKLHSVTFEEILESEYFHNKNKLNSLKDAVCGHEPICEFIVASFSKHGVILNPEDSKNPQLLITSIQKGYLKVVEELLKFGADVNKLYQSPVNYKSEVLMNYKRTTLLHVAVSSRQLEIVRLLINYRANVNAKDSMKETPLFKAVRNNDVEILKLLLAHYVKTGDEHELLRIAFKNECKRMIELLSRYIDINCKDESGRTLLHLCVSSYESNFDMFRFLLGEGANVNAKTVEGVTPLHKAVFFRHISEVDVLLKCNADVNAKDNEGATPLHDCVTNGDVDICRLLIKEGANVNSTNNKGATPLHLAATEGRLDILEVLLSEGADIHCRDLDGKTALHRAVASEDINVVKFLVDHNADVNSRIIGG